MTKGRALVRSEGRERVRKHSAPLHALRPSAPLQRPQKCRKSKTNPLPFLDKLKAGAGGAAALALLLYCAAADGIMEAAGPGGFLAVSAVILAVCAALISISATAEHYPQYKEALKVTKQISPSDSKFLADLTRAAQESPPNYVSIVALICCATHIDGTEYIRGYSANCLIDAIELLQKAVVNIPQGADLYQRGIDHIRQLWLPQITGRSCTHELTQ